MILVYGLGALVLLSLIAYFYNCNESVRAELRVQNDKKDKEDRRINFEDFFRRRQRN